jgi:hypothetical protein
MQNPVGSKVIPLSSRPNDDSKLVCDQDIRVLTTEEILGVAGGPEVDVEAGAGGG